MEREDDSHLGFGFEPSNETIIHCLEKKRLDPAFIHDAIEEINIYQFEPWDLPWKSKIESKGQVWYFFNKPYYKYTNSNREHRRTNEGYWKITGRGSKIKAKDSNAVIGGKTILLFYRHGPNPKEAKTEWVMHQFHAEYNPDFKEEFVVCRVERRREKRHSISANGERQSNQHSASSSRFHVTGNTFLEPTPPPSQQLVSNRSHQQTQPLSSDHFNLCSPNHASEIVFRGSQPPPNLHSISNSTDHTVENASPQSQLLSNHYMIPDSTIHVTANTSLDPQRFPCHSFISYSENQNVKSTLPNSLMPRSEKLVSPSGSHSAKDISLDSQSSAHLSCYSKNHVSKNTCPCQNSIFYSTNYMTENTFTESQPFLNYNTSPSSRKHIVKKSLPQFHLLSNQDLTPHPKNQIVENNLPEAQLVPNYNMIYCPANHNVGKNPSEFQPPLIHDLISDSRNPVVENASLELQLLKNNPSISNCRNLIVENTIADSQLLPNPDSETQSSPNQHLVSQPLLSPDLESQPLPNQPLVSKPLLNSDSESQPPPNRDLVPRSIKHALENTFPAEPLVSAELNAGNIYNVNDSFSTLQSPIHPEQGSSSFSVSSNDRNFWNSEFVIKQVDVPNNSERAFQDDYSWEGTGQTLTPDFNSVKSDGGVYVDDSSDMDIETINEWVNELWEDNTPLIIC